jgi:hypothetical protein
MLKQIFQKILKYFFVALLLTTAVGKLLDNRGFAQVISNYQLSIGEAYLLPLALFVSFFELSLGLSLIRSVQQKRNAILLILIHLGYSGLAALTLWRQIPLSNCGCFGVFWARPMTPMTLAEDVILVLLSVIFYFLV